VRPLADRPFFGACISDRCDLLQYTRHHVLEGLSALVGRIFIAYDNDVSVECLGVKVLDVSTGGFTPHPTVNPVASMLKRM